MTLFGADFTRLDVNPALEVQPLGSLHPPAIVLFLQQRYRYDEAMAERQEQGDELCRYIPVRCMIEGAVLRQLLEHFGRRAFDAVSDREIIRYLKEISLSQFGERIWDRRTSRSLPRNAVELTPGEGRMDPPIDSGREREEQYGGELPREYERRREDERSRQQQSTQEGEWECEDLWEGERVWEGEHS